MKYMFRNITNYEPTFIPCYKDNDLRLAIACVPIGGGR